MNRIQLLLVVRNDIQALNGMLQEGGYDVEPIARMGPK